MGHRRGTKTKEDHSTVIGFAELYTARIDAFELKKGGHNDVYLIKGSDDFALRVTPASHRSAPEIDSELHFMLYLKANGVPLAKPLQGKDGAYCYQRGDNTISAFEFAAGEDFWGRTEYPARLMEIGRTLGKIHRLSKAYVPAGVQPRRQWDANPHLVKAAAIFRDHDKRLSEAFEAYMVHMAQLRKDDDSYGLIHGDYLLSNYVFDQDDITVFDFDDCEYSWFVSDIAVCMLYYLIGGDPRGLERRAKEAGEWFSLIMRGYLTENTIGTDQIENMDLFFRMREYNLLSYNWEKKSEGFSRWQRDLVNGILQRIRHGKPFADIDFVSIYKSIR